MRPDPNGRPARALLITDVTMPGGVGTHIGQLSTVARELGWAVSVLMDDCSGADIIANSLTGLGIPVTRENLYWRYHSPQTVRKAVLTAFERDRPDVVHVHCGSPRSAALARELAVEASLPLIMTEHFVSEDLDISEDILCRVRQLYRQAFAVISVCDENRMLLREKFKLYADRHVVIRYGVHLPPEETRKTGGADFKAITVARLTRQKGIDVLIQAVAALPRDMRNRFQFTVLGSGEMESELKQLAKELCVEESIAFLGWSTDVQRHLRTHDLFILPSISEGQPIALLEALAAGLPCIASAVSGIPDALGDGKYGALVMHNDPGSLSQAIVAFAKDPIILRRKAAAARLHLLNNHDPRRNMGQVINLWEASVKFRKRDRKSSLTDRVS